MFRNSREAVPLVIRMIRELSPPYNAKLTNCYINNTLRYIKDDNTALSGKVAALINLIGVVRVLEEEKESNDYKMLYEVIDEVVKYTLNKKVLKVKALILDLVKTEYTEDGEYTEKEEKWIKEVVKDISSDIPLHLVSDSSYDVSIKGAKAFLSQEKKEKKGEKAKREKEGGEEGEEAGGREKELLSNITKYLLYNFVLLIIGEIKSLFISRNKKFGSKSALLVLNIKYLQSFVSPYINCNNDLLSLIKEIERNRTGSESKN